MNNRISYAQALMMAGSRQPATARDDGMNAQAGTPNGGTPEDMASQLMRAAPPEAASALRGSVSPSVSDGGRQGQSDPRYTQPPAGVPSDARQQGDPLAQAHAALIQELGPDAGEAAFKLLVAHMG
jgi:hypothetical protein